MSRMIIADMARNRWLVEIYSMNAPFIPLYLIMVVAVWPAIWGSWQAGAPELWRAGGGITNPGINTHHTLVLWLLAALYLGLRYRVRLDPMLAVSACFMVLSWHEIEWWIVDFALGRMANPVWLLGGYLYPLAMITTIFYMLAVNRPWRYIALMAVFYAAWFGIGFPVTVNWTGRTVLYDDPAANWIEIASWAWAVAAFWLAERAGLRRWQAEARGSIRVDRLVKQV